jgi:pyruvate kinase
MERQDLRPRRDERIGDRGEPARTEVAVAAAAVAAARMLHAPLIIAFTKSGFTVRIIAANRPPMPILGVTEVERTYRQLSLLWGVIPVYADQPPRYEAMLDAARERILAAGYAQSGDRVVTMAGIPFNVPSNTNSIKVEEV